MKRCPICDALWEGDKGYCPWDGHILKSLDDSFFSRHGRASTADLEPQFEIFADLVLEPEEIIEREKEQPPADLSNTQVLIDAAMTALEQQRLQDQVEARAHLKLFNEFNQRCQVLQLFINNLANKAPNFSWKVEYQDEWQKFWICFTLSFGQGRYCRNYPVTISYFRVPRREVALVIDLAEIASDKDKRHLRTEKAGGKVIYSNLTGYSYELKAPDSTPSTNLKSWLEQSFIKIFKLSYGAE